MCSLTMICCSSSIAPVSLPIVILICPLLGGYLTRTPCDGPRRCRDPGLLSLAGPLPDEEPLDVRRRVVKAIATERVVDDRPGFGDGHESRRAKHGEVVLDRRF